MVRSNKQKKKTTSLCLHGSHLNEGDVASVAFSLGLFRHSSSKLKKLNFSGLSVGIKIKKKNKNCLRLYHTYQQLFSGSVKRSNRREKKNNEKSILLVRRITIIIQHWASHLNTIFINKRHAQEHTIRLRHYFKQQKKTMRLQWKQQQQQKQLDRRYSSCGFKL